MTIAVIALFALVLAGFGLERWLTHRDAQRRGRRRKKNKVYQRAWGRVYGRKARRLTYRGDEQS